MSDWPISIKFDVKPQGKGRPRFGKGSTYTPDKTKLYENDLKWIAKSHFRGVKPLTGPVRMDFEFGFKSKELSYHVKKPDFDNIMKAVTDALNGIAYVDDCQICKGEFAKQNCGADYVSISIAPLTAYPDS